MEEKKNILTYQGLRKYEDELHDLKVVKRQEVAQKIKEAREQGDLSENAEYDAAKDEQRDIEARIEELEKILKNAEVVVEDEVDSVSYTHLSAILRAEAEKEKMIREAEGEAEAILKVQQATANGLRFIKDAGADDSVLRLKSLEALEKVADGKSTKIIIPSEIQNMAGLLTSAKELLSDK